MYLWVIPGLLPAAAIVSAIRNTAAPKQRQHQPIRIRVRSVRAGPLGRLMIGAAAFEIGNCATTLLILRATDLFRARHGETAAAQLVILLYVGYNMAAALVSVPAGRYGDRHNPVRVLAGRGGAVRGWVLLVRGPACPAGAAAPAFVLAGLGIGCGETAESAAVAGLAPDTLRVRRSGCWPRCRRAGT